MSSGLDPKVPDSRMFVVASTEADFAFLKQVFSNDGFFDTKM